MRAYRPQLGPQQVGQLTAALHSSRHTSGSTHGFYLYPARFSPEIARSVIELFSQPSDVVLDPFMGGGTSIVEGLMAGRRMIGVDLNALGHFVATVKTQPVSIGDATSLRRWASELASTDMPSAEPTAVVNLPRPMRLFMTRGLGAVQHLGSPRQQRFARCALLRLGQWALDCRDIPAPSQRRLGRKLGALVDEMLTGLDDFVGACGRFGIRKRHITGQRQLFCGDCQHVLRSPALDQFEAAPRLVFTSPPYPRVHVLYHRWQVGGRSETPAPYWIAQVSDGYFASHYTGGSRTTTGELRYFSMIRKAFEAVRDRLDPKGLVVQLVGFADAGAQLPAYLAAMRAAGFDEWTPPTVDQDDLWRRVPNRKWHARSKGSVDASSELLLFHRPRRRG